MASKAATLPEPEAEQSSPPITGYETDIRLFATRYKQGGRTSYGLHLTPLQIINYIPAPNPEIKSPGNRKIKLKHADEFARYFIERDDWVVPGMILRTPEFFDFEPLHEVEGITFGIITFPRMKLNDLHVLDGQHRILGFHLVNQKLGVMLDKAQSDLATARRVDPKGAAVREAQKAVEGIKAKQKRMVGESVSLEIIVESDPRAYKQMFFDISDNALGIGSSARVTFDSRKVVNRALDAIFGHDLFENRVEVDADRLSKGSPYLVSAKHVADEIRIANVGLAGRIGKNLEQELSEHEVATQARKFLDTLVAGFEPYQVLINGGVTPETFRKSNLLGSIIMMRVLAGVWYELTKNHAFDDEMVVEYFKKLSPHMSAPVYPGSIWMEHLPEVFHDGANAPSARRQEVSQLYQSLVAWAIDKPKFLNAKPKPRPEPVPEPEPEAMTEEELDAELRPEITKARKTKLKAVK